MSKQLVRNIVSIITIFGHLIVFIAALSLGIFSLLGGIDVTQTLLMASPILVVTALAAFTHVLDNPSQRQIKANVGSICNFMYRVSDCIDRNYYGIVLSILCSIRPIWARSVKNILRCGRDLFWWWIGGISRALFGVSTNR